MQKFRMITRLDVDGDDFVREPRGEFERLLGDAAPVFDGHDNNGWRSLDGERDWSWAARGHADHVIVAAHEAEKKDKQRNENDGDPSAFGKFCNEDHDNSDAGDESAKSVDESALHPMGTTDFPPVHDHAKLREVESHENSDGIECNLLFRDDSKE